MNSITITISHYYVLSLLLSPYIWSVMSTSWISKHFLIFFFIKFIISISIWYSYILIYAIKAFGNLLKDLNFRIMSITFDRMRLYFDDYNFNSDLYMRIIFSSCIYLFAIGNCEKGSNNTLTQQMKFCISADKDNRLSLYHRYDRITT